MIKLKILYSVVERNVFIVPAGLLVGKPKRMFTRRPEGTFGAFFQLFNPPIVPTEQVKTLQISFTKFPFRG